MERVAIALGEMQQTNEAGLTFHECADRGLLVLADDQIAFPVPGLGAVVGRERSLVDRTHRLFEPGPATVDALLDAAMIAVGA